MTEETKDPVGTRGIVLFVFLTCAISWTCAVLSVRNPLGLDEPGTTALDYAAKFGPSFAGIIVTGILLGRSGLGDLMGRLLHWRVRPGWYVLVIAYPILLAVAGAAIWYSMEDAAPTIHYTAAITFIGWFLARFLMGGGLGEELGWRGFMLPALQKKWGPVGASVIVGIWWGIWHWPAFFVDPEKMSPFPGVLVLMLLFVVLSIVYSLVFTYVYNGTGSLLLPVILHATMNGIDSTLDQVMPGQEGDIPAALLFLLSLTVILPLMIRQRRRGKALAAQ